MAYSRQSILIYNLDCLRYHLNWKFYTRNGESKKPKCSKEQSTEERRVEKEGIGKRNQIKDRNRVIQRWWGIGGIRSC